MAVSERDLSNQENVTLKINLGELFGDKLRDAPVARQVLAQEIIDKIVERTKDGVGANGKNLRTPYSEGYSNSLDFKAFGKSSKDVNMTLTGEMLSSMDIVSESEDEIVIGFSDSEQSEKAHGHITGKNGQAPKMKRDFFGLPEKEIRRIASDFKDDFEAPEEETTTIEDLRRAFEAAQTFRFR
jgi:hypothetical protein